MIRVITAILFSLLPLSTPLHAEPATQAATKKGNLSLTIKGGGQDATYSGELNKDSGIRIRKVGKANYLYLRLVSDLDEKTVMSLGISFKLAGEFKIGKYDLTKKMGTAGVGAKTTSRVKDPRYFSLVSMLGSGTLEVLTMDLDKGSITGKVTITHGGKTVTGTFETKEGSGLLK